MKNQFKFLFAAAIVLIASGLCLATGNVMFGLALAGVFSYVAQNVGNFSLVDMDGLLGCVTLTGIKRKCNVQTIGGAKRLYIALTEDIATEFLTFELAKTVGEFAGAIPMVVGKKWIEVEAWYDTTKFETEMKLGAGFTQSIEFKILGYNKEIVKFSALLGDTPINLIVQGNDDQLYYIGQKYIPIMLEMKGILPEKGTSRKEATFTGKQDGMQIPAFPLASTATFPVELLVGAEEPEGGA